MKLKILNKRKLILGISILSLLTFSILGCFKTTNKKITEQTSDQILNKIINDTNFTVYKTNLNLLVSKSFAKTNIEDIDEQDFIRLFKESTENNLDSKTKISNYLGFQNSNEFWNIRTRLNSSLSQLIRKYDFKKVSKNQWYPLFKKSNKISLNQLQPIVTTFMLNPNNCIEQYKDCIDDANAQFSVEVLGCVGWGALGWTVVGGVLFVGCEGLSYYHLTTMKRKCESSYKSCK